jgi:hypothetical protein
VKGGKTKKEVPSNQNPNPKQESWWVTEMIPEPEENTLA